MDELDALRSELEALRRRQDELLARLERIAAAEDADDGSPNEVSAATGGSASTPSSGPDDVAPDAAVPRVRRRLALGGAAAALATALSASRATPAAAADGEPVAIGETNTSTRQTSIVNGSAAGGAAGAPLTNVDALLVVDNRTSTRSTGSAIDALGRARAVTAATIEGGTVIDARAGAVSGVGVSASAAGAGGVGVIATGSAIGIRAGGGAVAGEFIGNSYGVTLAGPRPLVFTSGHGTLGPPVTTGQLGEVAFDLEGSLYLCVGAGTPGRWRRLAGPASAGSLHLLSEPRRVYDSRSANAPLGPSNGGPKGAMSPDEVRLIDCTANGAAVPADATGLMFNLAITETNAAGFLTAWGTGTQPLASSMNWYVASTTLSNSVTIGAGLGATFQLYCGGGGITHVIVDVAGYYR